MHTNMNNRIYILGGISLLLIISAVGYFSYSVLTKPTLPAPISVVISSPTSTPITASVKDTTPPLIEVSSLIVIKTPQPGMVVTSPLSITGEARGMWYFEASFPIELQDSEGLVLATSVATASGEWMTEEFVPFASSMTWASTTATSGVLVLKRDNPSGMPEHDKSMLIPVRFTP